MEVQALAISRRPQHQAARRPSVTGVRPCRAASCLPPVPPLGCRMWDERDDGHWLPGGGGSQRLLLWDPAFANLVGDTVEMPTVASLPTVHLPTPNGNPCWRQPEMKKMRPQRLGQMWRKEEARSRTHQFAIWPISFKKSALNSTIGPVQDCARVSGLHCYRWKEALLCNHYLFYYDNMVLFNKTSFIC